jgi:aryl-phospho-beta-D-glucosidase BglC (GH1 family)
MQAWGFNAARVNLNESCWLGVQGTAPAVSGAAYRAAIESYVDALNAAGMYVLVDMHFSSTGGSSPATDQEPMPDATYGTAFWTSVASAFEGNHAVIFDLFNEPYPNDNTDSAASWTCDLKGSAGGTCSGFSYTAVGMQAMLDAVRATGATNVVMIGGPQYAGDVDQWLQYEPVDTLNPPQLAASVHVYWDTPSNPDYSPCYASSCWTGQLAPLAQVVPVVTGEFGEMDCGDTLYPPYLDFADANGVSYLAWAWFAGGCDGPSLLGTSQSDYASGTPSAEGVAYEQHLEALGLGKP